MHVTAQIPLQVRDCVGHNTVVNKKTLQLGLRISEADLRLLRKAVDKLWPGMPIANATLVLTLARQRAVEILKRPKKRG